MSDPIQAADVLARHVHLDYQRTWATGDVRRDLCRECDASWPCDAVTMAAEVTRLRGLLAKYGGHHKRCDDHFFGSIRPGVPCSCGWDEVQKGLTDE